MYVFNQNHFHVLLVCALLEKDVQTIGEIKILANVCIPVCTFSGHVTEARKIAIFLLVL